MKIAYFVENYGKNSETFIVECLKGLSKKNFHGLICVDKEIENQIAPPLGFDIVETNFSSSFNFFFKLLNPFIKTIYLKRFIFNFRNLFVTKVLHKILKMQKPDLAYIEFGFNAVLVRNALENLKIPYIVTFHGKDATQLFGDQLYNENIKKVFDGAFKIISVSNHIKRRLILQGCSKNKIETIYNTMNFDLIDVNINSSKNKGKKLIFVGRLVEKKNPIALIHSFNIVRQNTKNAELVIVGDGPLLKICKKLVSDLKLDDKVFFAGALGNSEAIKLMYDSDIYVQHSVSDFRGDQEGFPITLLEAQAVGLPVVTTIHSGCVESVVDNKSGFLVPEYNFEMMAKKIIYLIENPKIASQMGEYAKNRVSEMFTPEKRLNSIIRIIHEVKK